VIFADTNLVSETVRLKPDPRATAWIRAHDAELAISAIVLAEISFGIERIRPDERARRLDGFVAALRQHFAGRIFSFDEESSLIFGALMGEAARRGRLPAVADGMIAAIALRHGAALATRNHTDFDFPQLKIVNPWQ